MYTLQGKTWYTWHVHFWRQFMYATHTFSAGSLRTWQPFASHQQRWMDHTAFEKKGSWYNPQHASWLIHMSTTQFFSQDNHRSSNKSQTPINNRLHQFTEPITPACHRYIQYLLTGANLSVLNRHRRGLQSWRCRLAISHSPTFSTDDPLVFT
jgi:hypothetical protein